MYLSIPKMNGGGQNIWLQTGHVVAGMDARATLTHENVAREHELTVGALGAQTLRVAVAAVAGGAHSLFMREKLQIHLEHVPYLRSLKSPSFSSSLTDSASASLQKTS